MEQKKKTCWTNQVRTSHVQNVYSLAPDQEMFLPAAYVLLMCARALLHAYLVLRGAHAHQSLLTSDPYKGPFLNEVQT